MTTEEMFDILDQDGRSTGRIASKYEVHLQGMWHLGVHLCITDGTGHVYQQLRGSAPDVRILPDVWDLFAVAGHVAAGEDPVMALLREINEEIGRHYTISELHSKGLYKVSVTRSNYWVVDPGYPDGGYWHRVFDHNFVVRVPLDLGTLQLEPKKIIAVRSYQIQQLRADLKRPGTAAYDQHAHRPPENGKLYETVLDAAEGLTLY